MTQKASYGSEDVDFDKLYPSATTFQVSLTEALRYSIGKERQEGKSDRIRRDVLELNAYNTRNRPD